MTVKKSVLWPKIFMGTSFRLSDYSAELSHKQTIAIQTQQSLIEGSLYRILQRSIILKNKFLVALNIVDEITRFLHGRELN